MNEDLRKAVVDQFLNNWSGSNVCPGSNHNFKAPITESWVKIRIDEKSTVNAEVGSTMQRVSGDIVVECYVPVHSGLKGLSLMEDEVISIFQNKNFDGVSCRASSIVKIGAKANWYQHDVATVFQYDVFS